MQVQSQYACCSIVVLDGQGGVQITWDSPEQLEDYTNRLRAAAERLTAENRRLRRCHADLVVKVGGVMSVDLLRQPQRWKDLLMEMRHMMASLVQVCVGVPSQVKTGSSPSVMSHTVEPPIVDTSQMRTPL